MLFRRHIGCVVIAVGILLLYLPVLDIYFQQDEWHNFGWHLYNLQQSGVWGAFVQVMRSHVPIAQAFTFLNFYLFGVQNIVPGVLMLLLIISNSILWYINGLKISGSRFVAAGAVLFGYTSLVSIQSITWVIPGVAAQLAFFFVNLSVLACLLWIDGAARKYIIISLISALLAVWSKTNGAMIFFVLPIILLLYRDKYVLPKITLRQFFACASVFALVSGVFCIRSGNLFQWSSARAVGETGQALVNLFCFPLKAIPHLILEPVLSINIIADYLVLNRYHLLPNDPFKETIIIEQLSVIFGLLFVLAFSLICKKCSSQRKTLAFAAAFFAASFVPYVFDRTSTGAGFLESRYYYLGAFGLGLFLMAGIKELQLAAVRIPWVNRRVLAVVLVMFGSLYLIPSIFEIKRSILQTTENTIKRKEVLAFIRKEYLHKIGNNLVLYIREAGCPGGQSDAGILRAYFQSGILYQFLVYAFDSRKFDADAFKDDKLWDIGFQGATVTGKGVVGIFFNYDAMGRYLAKEKKLLNSVFAIEVGYRGTCDVKKATYKDITQEVRDSLGISTKEYSLSPNTKIVGDIDIVDSHSYFAVNALKTENRYFNAHEVIVYKDGLENSYGGPYLKITQNGSGKSRYIFASSSTGYDLGFVSSVRLNGESCVNRITYSNSVFEIDFLRPVKSADVINVSFGLNGKTLVYQFQEPYSYLLESSNLHMQGNGSTIYNIPLPGTLRSLRHIWMNDLERYVPVAYVGGKIVRIKEWTGLDSKELRVVFPSPVYLGQKISLPVLFRTALKRNEIRYRKRAN